MADPTARDGEIIRLRNRTRALEANGAELLARAEQAEATVKRVEALRDHWRWTHAIDAANELSAALAAPERPATAPTAVSAATEAHGGAGEAQRGSGG